MRQYHLFVLGNSTLVFPFLTLCKLETKSFIFFCSSALCILTRTEELNLKLDEVSVFPALLSGHETGGETIHVTKLIIAELFDQQTISITSG